MSDILNIRVATDLTDRQNNILREEKSAGRQVYFHNGRLCYRERRSPPPQPPLLQQDWESSPPRCRRYPQRTKQTVPSRNGALENQATPLFSDMEEFPLLHRQTTGRSLHQTGIHRELKRLNNCQYREGHPPQGVLSAKQCRGPEDSSHRDTRTTTTQTSRDGPGTTAPSSPSRSIDVQPPIFRRTPIEEILVVNMHSLQTASPVATKPFDTQDTNDASGCSCRSRYGQR